MASELMSALLDGECSVSEVHALLDLPDPSAALMQQWSRMNRVREVLAGKPLRQLNSATDSEAFCADIMANLGEMAPVEATVAIPAIPPAIGVSSHPKVVNLPIRQRDAEIRRLRRSRPLIGWAAAASVTMVALASGRVWMSRGALPWMSPANSVASNNSGSNVSRGDVVPVSAQAFTASNQEPTETRWTQLDPEAARELSDYMIEHNNSRAEQGMNGELGYARIAARNIDYRLAGESR